MRVDVLVDVARAVQAAVTRLAYGLRGEETLARVGTARDIGELTRLEVAGLRAGSTLLEFQLAAQSRPFEDLDVGREALDAFEAGLISLAAGDAPPRPWDERVVQALAPFTRVLRRGIDEIDVGRPGTARERRAVFTRETVLERRPPVEEVREHVEVEGRLLMADFAASREEARIHRPLDPPIRCTFSPDLERTVARLLRRYVRARGRAAFDDQGRIRVLELESLEDAEPGHSFWELATLEELAEEQGVEPVERLEDLAADFWPKDESVDEFLAAIESRH